MSTASPPSSARTRSWRKKLLFAVITTLAFCVLFEGVLAVLGVRPGDDRRDPLVGFTGSAPLLEAAEGPNEEPVWAVAESKLVWFNAQSFPRRKAPGTRRVFCLGGSTTYGRPYWDSTSYCRWLRELLPLADPSVQWEVINAGGISYASYRVAAVMEELAKHEPDLFIVYSGHNEFLERRTYAGMFERPGWLLSAGGALSRTRTWTLFERLAGRQPRTLGDKLPAEVDEMLNHTVGPTDYHRDDAWRTKVVGHYRFNLERMTRIAREAGAEFVLIAPVANESGCSPFKSETSAAAPEQLERFQLQLEAGRLALGNGDPQTAIACLDEACQLQDRHALAHYLRGEALLRLERPGAAQQAFRRALNEDVCPLRAVDEIEKTVHEVARSQRVPLVDVPHQLRRISEERLGHGCLGQEFFLDHVHPTLEVHREIGLWTLQTLQQRGIVSGSLPSDDQVASIFREIQRQLEPESQGVALRNLAKVLHWSGKFDEAALRAEDALRRIPNDAESRFVLADCLANQGRFDEADEQFDQLLRETPDYWRAYIRYARVLSELAQWDRARVHLEVGVEMEPDNAYGHYLLGVLLLRGDELPEAEASLRHALELKPGELSSLFHLARVLAKQGDHRGAIALLEEVLQAEPQDADTHNELGWSLLQTGRTSDAIQHFEAALRADPEHEEARANLRFAQEVK